MWLTYVLGSLLHVQATHFASLGSFHCQVSKQKNLKSNKIMNYILEAKSMITTKSELIFVV